MASRAELLTARYWVGRGFSEADGNDMVSFLRRVEECTRQLREGNPVRIHLPSTAALLHNHRNEELMPFWMDFVDALSRYDRRISETTLRGISLSQPVLDLLSPALKTVEVGGLDCFFNQHNPVGGGVIPLLTEIATSNHRLSELLLRSYNIGRVGDMQQLCRSIGNRTLTLYNCFDGTNEEMVQTLLESSRDATGLLLPGNRIGLQGAAQISAWLGSNPSLRSLSLSENHLSDDAAGVLANSLPTNTNLSAIWLSRNNITAQGRRALLMALFDPESLETCIESNHACQMYGLTPDISRINNRANGKDMKIFTVLSASGDGFFDESRFGTVARGLVPAALSRVQRFNSNARALFDAHEELTGFRSADWDKVRAETLPLTSVFELVRTLYVPLMEEMYVEMGLLHEALAVKSLLAELAFCSVGK